MNHNSLRLLAPRIFLLLLAFTLDGSVGGAVPVADVDLGHLTMNYISVPWPSPESLLENLRAKDYETRDRALSLVGVHQTTEFASFDPPEETELRYADLGVDGTQQAIIGVRRHAMLYGAVAARGGSRWHRIAAFSCWCKSNRETSSQVSFAYKQVPALGRNSCSGPTAEEQVSIRNSKRTSVTIRANSISSLLPGVRRRSCQSAT
jgi:hypothetical protein